MAPFPIMMDPGCEPTMKHLYRMIKERFDKSDNNLERMSQFDQQDETLDKLMNKMRETRQRLTGLEQEARQAHPAAKTDIKTDTKTHKRTQDAAADRVMNGDRSSAPVDPDPMYVISFGDDSIDFRLFLAGITSWSAKTLRHQCLVSPRGDAHANSHRWLTSRRHSLYSAEDHL